MLEGDDTGIETDASGPPSKRIKVSNGIANGGSKLLSRSSGMFSQSSRE